MTTIIETLAERGKRYGKFTGHALITQILKMAMRGDFIAVHQLTSPAYPNLPVRDELHMKFKGLTPDQREALEMIAHKIGRILNGDPDYADSWRDIAGYAQLVCDRLEGVER